MHLFVCAARFHRIITATITVHSLLFSSHCFAFIVIELFGSVVDYCGSFCFWGLAGLIFIPKSRPILRSLPILLSFRNRSVSSLLSPSASPVCVALLPFMSSHCVEAAENGSRRKFVGVLSVHHQNSVE